MPKPDRPRSPAAKPEPSAKLIAAGAAYAAAELAVSLLFGFFRLGRAEALLFFALRPWLLIAAAAAVASFPLRSRAIFYGSALLLAALAQGLFLTGLGAGNPWPEAGRGLVAGSLLAIVIDAVLQLGRRLLPRFGTAAASLALILLLLIPGALRPYEFIALGPSHAAAAAEKPDLMLMSALPLMWGEAGPLDPSSKPAAVHAALEREFRLRPLDTLDAVSLARGRLLLLAQPRALAPGELVALDAWVRAGGKALILTDPALYWPSELALGDIRRPPPVGLLGPLLTHWGLALERPEKPRAELQHVKPGAHARRLAMFAPGRFIKEGGACTLLMEGRVARCAVGKGVAVLLPDADMMHDRLWVGDGPDGAERHARISDNPLILADWLDLLAGRSRDRAAAPVQWLIGDYAPGRALLLALLPLAVAAAPMAWRTLSRSR